MIGQLRGTLLAKHPPALLVEAGGVGYEVEAPMSTFYNLPAVGSPVMLHTHLTVREDAHLLFGFATAQEKSLFRELIRISGIGPKSALTILSGISVDDFWVTLRAADAAKLTRLPGIGKKTAERLIVEMRDRADRATSISATALPVAQSPLQEARAALVSLGYKPAEAERLTSAGSNEGLGTDQIIREALKRAVR